MSMFHTYLSKVVPVCSFPRDTIPSLCHYGSVLTISTLGRTKAIHRISVHQTRSWSIARHLWWHFFAQYKREREGERETELQSNGQRKSWGSTNRSIWYRGPTYQIIILLLARQLRGVKLGPRAWIAPVWLMSSVETTGSSMALEPDHVWSHSEVQSMNSRSIERRVLFGHQLFRIYKFGGWSSQKGLAPL